MNSNRNTPLLAACAAIAALSFIIDDASAQQGPRPGGAPAPAGDPSFVAQLNDKDANQDGQLSYEEAIANGGFFREALFKAIDADGDGGISKAEATQADKVDKYQGPSKKIQFEGKTWVADNAMGTEVVSYKGKTALHLVGREQCYVYLPIDDFQDGVIEVDIAGDVFSGIGFRGRQKGQRVEKLYFRPQNAHTERHQNSVQYGVIGREDGHWRYLRTNFPGKYETGADIKQGEWFHARLVIKGETLKVFVNGSDKPLLTVDPMLDGKSKGSVGLWGWDSYFANFKYTPAK